MKKIIIILLVMISVSTAVAKQIQTEETIQKVFPMTADQDSLFIIVDNVFGSIHVSGHAQDRIELTVQKTIVAKNESRHAFASSKVSLDIFEDENGVEFYVDGPFRDLKRDQNIHWRGYKREGYKVIYDFDLKVPVIAQIDVSTVIEGDIHIVNMQGNFHVKNVNGNLRMEKIRGSGKACAINGNLQVDFNENPQSSCEFNNINGDIRIYCKPKLSADVFFKTMNGDAFTDYEVTSSVTNPFKQIEKNGKTVYRYGCDHGIRIGSGDVEIRMETINGDMYVLNGPEIKLSRSNY